ncbi:outer membrane protein, cobalt-zinc-cadmium efflux system [Mariniphaga anaerophila]|uniref:Outer membrane protein, cobalt-zinc-cadmium efflux system n=1 Tax=Mariniphaga anaerophila TaxID=1484053 RepID=A0A1M4YTH2_9BACT|nr:TolC family protein [Mariniphaga anaerophila]SHF09134.1 outer membrane protein, cobalt-zinc-cadmium efflux system [Mariniphaga anaerophila]
MNRLYLILIISILSFYPATAQDNKLTIEEAVQFALEKNAKIQQMRAILKQKENSWRSETGISAPEISYFKEGIGNGPGDAFDEKRFSVSQEFDFPVTAAYRLKGLSEEAGAMKLELDAVEKEVTAEIKSYYVEVLYAISLQKSRKNQLALAEDLYNAVYTKYETGMANGIDLANAELRLDEAKNGLDQSEWILHKARYGLFYNMGLPEEQQLYSITFSDTLMASDIRISQIQTLLTQKDHPRLLATEHEIKSTEYFLKEARSNILPDIRLNLYKQNLGDGYNFRGFEVGLQIPIWYPFEQKGKINQALAKKEEIVWKQKEVGLEIKRQIEYAWHNYDVSRNIINRYNETMKSKATQLRDLSLRAYQLGEIDLLNLLTAQQTFLDSELRYLTALRDYYLQLVSLEKYLGQELVY